MSQVTRRDVMKSLGVGAAAGVAGLLPWASRQALTAAPAQAPNGSKRDRMLRFLDGQGLTNYVPAAFFLHFDPAFHRGQAAVDKHLEYFRATDMDFVKIQYELIFPARPQIMRPSDWRQMPLYREDFYAPQIDVLKGLVKAAKKDALMDQA